MGFQLRGPTKGKIDHFVTHYAAEQLAQPPENFVDIPQAKALICVVDTITYETAFYCFNAAEFSRLNDAGDFRVRAWLLMDRRVAEGLCQFSQSQTEEEDVI